MKSIGMREAFLQSIEKIYDFLMAQQQMKIKLGISYFRGTKANKKRELDEDDMLTKVAAIFDNKLANYGFELVDFSDKARITTDSRLIRFNLTTQHMPNIAHFTKFTGPSPLATALQLQDEEC
ncbi:hypothetical protein Ciccas_000956 [Cichlidogyrus casuarinus]|uniref:Uncharacterized protein n=1 Tax=Cichlidogyrus casuarinus TaxID=1844966 RepID=A0ABD2QNP8_9PLAT